MKKITAIIISLLCLVGCGNPNTSTIKHIQKKINLDITNCNIETDKDEHGGFHGDGDYFVKAQCQDDFDNEIKKTGLWKELPLTENLELIMYGGKKDDVTYVYELANNAGIPKIENGYYYFIDRHTESQNKYSDLDLFNRYSFNFTIALYDNDTNILYYYEFDT